MLSYSVVSLIFGYVYPELGLLSHGISRLGQSRIEISGPKVYVQTSGGLEWQPTAHLCELDTVSELYQGTWRSSRWSVLSLLVLHNTAIIISKYTVRRYNTELSYSMYNTLYTVQCTYRKPSSIYMKAFTFLYSRK